MGNYPLLLIIISSYYYDIVLTSRLSNNFHSNDLFKTRSQLDIFVVIKTYLINSSMSENIYAVFLDFLLTSWRTPTSPAAQRA